MSMYGKRLQKEFKSIKKSPVPVRATLMRKAESGHGSRSPDKQYIHAVPDPKNIVRTLHCMK